MLCVALTTRWPPTKLKEKKVKYWFMNTYHCFLKFSSENRNYILHVVKILLEKAVQFTKQTTPVSHLDPALTSQ